MPDFSALPTAEAVGSLGSLLAIICLAATLLILWQVAILLGAIIANMLHHNSTESVGPLDAG
jgi:hypothetical protein